MARRIEKALGAKVDTLTRMQADYDMAQTRAGNPRAALSLPR
jgi:plasmid maintenance system antidote protein VapI